MGKSYAIAWKLKRKHFEMLSRDDGEELFWSMIRDQYMQALDLMRERESSDATMLLVMDAPERIAIINASDDSPEDDVE